MIYIILFAILAALIVALYFAFQLYRKEKKLRLEAEYHNEFLRGNIRILQDNVEAVKEIKEVKTGIDKKIKEAQTDEEVNNIISSIIDANNNRVLND